MNPRKKPINFEALLFNFFSSTLYREAFLLNQMKEVDNERSFRFKYFSIQMKKVKFQLSYQEVYSLQEILKYNSNFGNKNGI